MHGDTLLEYLGAFLRWALTGCNKKFSFYLNKRNENVNVVLGVVFSVIVGTLFYLFVIEVN